MASIFSKKPKTTPAVAQVVLLSSTESENATFDFSDEAHAKRQAEEAARLTATAGDVVAGDAATTKPPLRFSIPDGTNPVVTWPSECTTDPMGNVTYTGQAEIRESFVHTPAPFSRFDDKTPVCELNIAPSHFLIDTLENPQELCAAMNAHAGAPSLDRLYDKATMMTAPRFYCPWPKRFGAIKRPTNDQMVRTLLRFSLPLSAAATTGDVLAFMASLPGAQQTSLPLSLAPGVIESNPIARFSDGNVPNRRLHFIPVRATIMDVHNTIGIPFEVELRVPNMERKESEKGTTHMFTTASDPIGLSSTGPIFASSCKDRLNTVCAFNSYAFNSPEAARWLTIADREQEEKNFSNNIGGDVVRVNRIGDTVMVIPLTAEPATLAQFIAVSYPGHLAAASDFVGLDKLPVINTNEAGKEDTPFGHVVVLLEAVLLVFRHFCDLYSPSNFAVNNHKWVLHASPSNKEAAAEGLHALRILSLRDERQGCVKSAQLEYTVEIIQLPYEGPQRLSAKDKDLLAEISSDHYNLTSMAKKMQRAAIAKATTGTAAAVSRAVIAKSAADVASMAAAYPSASSKTGLTMKQSSSAAAASSYGPF